MNDFEKMVEKFETVKNPLDLISPIELDDDSINELSTLAENGEDIPDDFINPLEDLLFI